VIRIRRPAGRINGGSRLSRRPSRFGFFHGALDSRENELWCRAALSGSGLMEPAVKVARQVDRGTDRTWLHTHRLCADDLSNSTLTVGCLFPLPCPWGKHSAPVSGIGRAADSSFGFARVECWATRAKGRSPRQCLGFCPWRSCAENR
jgi:hypothetical protein